MNRETLIACILACSRAATYRAPIEYRHLGWVHKTDGRRLGAGTSGPFSGTTWDDYDKRFGWVTVIDGSANGIARETFAEKLAEQNAYIDRQTEKFRQALGQMDDKALASQLEYWRTEAVKRIKLHANGNEYAFTCSGYDLEGKPYTTHAEIHFGRYDGERINRHGKPYLVVENGLTTIDQPERFGTWETEAERVAYCASFAAASFARETVAA